MLLGLEFQRVGRVPVLELGVVGVPEVGVAVQGDLAVQRQDLIVGGANQRVDLDQSGVLFDEDLPQLGDGHRRGVEHLGGQVALLGDGSGECQIDAGDRVDRNLGQPLGLGGGHLFDFHSALDRAHRQVGAVGTVEQKGDVVLLGDVAGFGHQQLLHDVALDVQTQDVRGVGEGFLGRGRVLHPTGFAAPTGFHLSLHHHRPADLRGDGLGVRGGSRHPSGSRRNLVFGEQFLRLILEKVHGCLVC